MRPDYDNYKRLKYLLFELFNIILQDYQRLKFNVFKYIISENQVSSLGTKLPFELRPSNTVQVEDLFPKRKVFFSK